MSVRTQKPILISGAGIGSLLLAQCLLRASIPFLIFERDSSFSFRAQGYRLLLSSAGLDAVESVLGPEKFRKFWDTCGKTAGGGFANLDAITGLKISEDVALGNKSRESEGDKKRKDPQISPFSRDGKIVGISRGDMRDVFATGCEAFISWSHPITGYEVTSSGVCAVFADGSKSIEGEMLIGGDGLYSKVAKQLSQGKLQVYDTGLRVIHGQSPTRAFKGLGEWVWQMLDDSNPNGRVSVITNVRSDDMDNPNKRFGWSMSAEPHVIKEPNDDFSIIGPSAAKVAKALTANWHPRFQPLFEEMIESEAAFWKITCSTPSGVPEWRNESRVTLIGDAVHSMTPAAGLGANTAVRDSALLGKLLAEAGGYKESLTAAFEKDMRVYASEAVKRSYAIASTTYGFTIDENSNTV